MRATQVLASAMLALSACQISAVAQVQSIPATSASTSSSVTPANLQIQITTVSAKSIVPASAERKLNDLRAEGNSDVFGALMLCGGGPLPPKLLETFFELGQASRGSLVIIPSASSYADTGDFEPMLLPWQQFPWASVQVLHANNRNQIESDVDFVKPLQQATAVWISGGDQRRLAERYLGTPVEKELKKVVDRGGIIGGTSAGSAIASRVMISGGRQQPVIANGLDLLPGAIIDQHFSQRNATSDWPRLYSSIRIELVSESTKAQAWSYRRSAHASWAPVRSTSTSMRRAPARSSNHCVSILAPISTCQNTSRAEPHS